jgi:hypothetical protein
MQTSLVSDLRRSSKPGKDRFPTGDRPASSVELDVLGPQSPFLALLRALYTCLDITKADTLNIARCILIRASPRRLVPQVRAGQVEGSAAVNARLGMCDVVYVVVFG